MNNWIYKVFLLTFLLSIIFTGVTNVIAYNTNQIILLILIIVSIILANIFDMISTSALTSKEATFHAMNSQKVKGAKEAIWLVKNNVQVVSVCSDVIGDILGITSGGLGAVLALNLADATGFNITITLIIVMALISAFTVSTKALSKEIAVKKSDQIIFKIGKIVRIFKKQK